MELFPDVAELGNYRYSCFITSLTLPAKAVYDLYRGRADSENRIKEIKYDFSADKFSSQDFWATEACDSFIIMAYNFISLFIHAIRHSLDSGEQLRTLTSPELIGPNDRFGIKGL